MKEKMDSFRIQQQLSLKATVILSLSTFLRSTKFRKYALYFFTIIASTILLGGLAGPKAFIFESIMGTLIPAVSFVVLMFIIFVFISIFAYYMEKKKSKEVFYRFNHWGIHKEIGGEELSNPWRDAKEFKETQSYFFIYMKPSGVVPVQKNMFSNEAEVNEFSEFIQERLQHT
jgi:YcxB-like protein